MKSKTISILTLLTLTLPLMAGAVQPVGAGGAVVPRSAMMSYDIRANAETYQYDKSSFYVPLAAQLTAAADGYSVQTDIPFEWLDRDVFLHVEGLGRLYEITVDNSVAGSTQDGRTPADFLISPFITDGRNTISLRQYAAESAAITAKPVVYIWSQPKVHIEDYSVGAVVAPSGANGKLSLQIALSNSYNYAEKIAVGYDIYAPTGELIYYDKRDMEIPGMGRDTMRFTRDIPRAAQNMWSPAKPNLYRVMMIIWREGRIVEYVPFKIGFTKGDPAAALETMRPLLQAGKSAQYNVADSRMEGITKTKTDLAALKAKGVNLIRVSYPQPAWFYDLCDASGLWVVDQADIAASRAGSDAQNDDPRVTQFYIQRQQAMFAISHNHVSVAAWSPGVGRNGYNMYKSYLWLKSADPIRPVLFDGADGQWNSDL